LLDLDHAPSGDNGVINQTISGRAFMNRAGKLSLLFAFSVAAAFLAAGKTRGQASQPGPPDYKNNNCVTCHAQLAEPLHTSSKYLEWQLSTHQARGVSCEKCHGGDPATADKKKGHAGILPSLDLKSRLNVRNQPETCNACHQDVIAAFVQSPHYKQLMGLGLGPSCSNCHAHMATRVVYDAAETAGLCARCHNSPDFMPPRPQIPVQGRETMEALQRAGGVIRWAQLLLADGQRSGRKLDAEVVELKRGEAILKDARVKWHAFNLEAVRRRADEAYASGAKTKETLRKKLLNE
jgi:Cytochrome c7 and related cytochrome c/Cytochrome c554 and c-prime